MVVNLSAKTVQVNAVIIQILHFLMIIKMKALMMSKCEFHETECFYCQFHDIEKQKALEKKKKNQKNSRRIKSVSFKPNKKIF